MKMCVAAFASFFCTVFPLVAESAGIRGNSVSISWDGYLITADHVIAGCASLNAVGIGPVIAVANDKANDLALLKSNAEITTDPLPLSMGAVRRGDEVIAVGYSLQGILGGLNVMNGNVYDLPNNSARLEFTAPTVQVGNSGGAVLDRSGTLVGILSAARTLGSGAFGTPIGILLSMHILGGGVFAVRSEVIQMFLSAQSVRPVLADRKPERSHEDIVELARKSVFAIECLN